MMFKARILVPKGTKRSYKPSTFHFFSPTQPPTFFYLSAVTTVFMIRSLSVMLKTTEQHIKLHTVIRN